VGPVFSRALLPYPPCSTCPTALPSPIRPT